MKRKIFVSASFILILILSVILVFFQTRGRTLEYEIEMLENKVDMLDVQKVYYEKNIVLIDSQEISYDTIKAETTQGEISLFTVKQERYSAPPFIYTNADTLVVYYDGRICYDGGEILERQGKLQLHHAYFSPIMYIYSFDQGTIQEVVLKDNNMAILDVFDFDGKIYFLGEEYSRFTSSLSEAFLYSIDGNTVNKETKLNFNIVAETPLYIKGMHIKNNYIFPSKNGIYNLDVKTMNTDLILKYDFENHAKAYLFHEKKAFYIAEEVVSSEAPNLRSEDTCFILQYDNSFIKTERTEFPNFSTCLDWIGEKNATSN